MSYFDDLPQIDRDTIKAIVTDALKAGYTISVYDGEEYCLKRSTVLVDILGALCSTDDDRLYFRAPGEEKAFGWAWLVYGNEPGVVVSDYTVDDRTAAILARANALADAYEG
jgi:hypothetical protein